MQRCLFPHEVSERTSVAGWTGSLGETERMDEHENILIRSAVASRRFLEAL